MNILITLPRNLLNKILAGKKKMEMRKVFPQKMVVGEDGFFIVEKGTNKVRCWCLVDAYFETDCIELISNFYSKSLCVSEEYIMSYGKKGKRFFLWHIGKVHPLENVTIQDLMVRKNPQSFVYCPSSNGEPC